MQPPPAKHARLLSAFIYLAAVAATAIPALLLSPLQLRSAAPRVTIDDAILLLLPHPTDISYFNLGAMPLFATNNLGVWWQAETANSHTDTAYLAARGASAAELAHCARTTGLTPLTNVNPQITKLAELSEPQDLGEGIKFSSIHTVSMAEPWTFFQFTAANKDGHGAAEAGSCDFRPGTSWSKTFGARRFTAPALGVRWPAAGTTPRSYPHGDLGSGAPGQPIDAHIANAIPDIGDPAWTRSQGTLPGSLQGGNPYWVGEVYGTEMVSPIDIQYSVPSEQDQQQRRTFISGVLLGISAGFLTALIQSIITRATRT